MAMIRRIMVCLVLCVVTLLPAFAQQKKPSKSYVLKAGHMFDGKSNAVVTPGLVVVSDGKIVGVGASAELSSAAQVTDLGDATLLPGFIDAHTHLTMMYSEDYAKAALDGLRKPIPEMALDASVNARITLMAGFTTVRDVGSRYFLDAGLRNAIERGVVPGPRMLVSVHAIGATGGHCDETGYGEGALGPETGPDVGVINGPDEPLGAVRLAREDAPAIIKTFA